MSFTNANILRKTNDFIGLDNYIRMASDEVFWLSLRHSLALTAIVVVLQLVFGLVLASAMNQNLPGMGVFKSIIMASWVIPVAATVTMFKFMAQPDIGLYNIIFSAHRSGPESLLAGRPGRRLRLYCHAASLAQRALLRHRLSGRHAGDPQELSTRPRRSTAPARCVAFSASPCPASAT